MKRFLFLCSLFPALVFANSIRLINNSPYDLRAVIRGGDGSFLGEVVVKAQKESGWTDTYGQFGMSGGANPRYNQDTRSKTPYAVLWYCMDGGDYGMCDVVSTGAVVTASSCMGARMCKAQKKEQYPYRSQDSYYPDQPQGNYLHPETPASPSN